MSMEIPIHATITDTDAAAALTAAGWTVKPPEATAPPVVVVPPTDDHSKPITGWPTVGGWEQGGRLVASDNFNGSDLSPLWARGIAYQCDYPGARPGWAKQAESQWNVPGVYDPGQLHFDGKKMRIGLEYHSEGAPGPPGNNPAYYWSGAFNSCPASFNGTYSGHGFAQVGFAFKAGTTPICIEWKCSMPRTAPLDWTWQGAWLCSLPEWKLEFDLTESVGNPPGRPIQTTSHYSDTGGSAGDKQVSTGPWSKQPQAGETHVYTAVLNPDCSLHLFMDGNWMGSNPAVNGQGQWMYFIHQGGLVSPVRNYVPSFTSDYQDFEYFRAWQPASLPVGTGIHGGGTY